MSEATFREAVYTKLPTGVHRQAMHASAMSYPGTPDTYLDWHHDLWIETKILPYNDRLPKSIPLRALPTEQQYRWLERRWKAGGNALCLVGFKIKTKWHGWILAHPDEWNFGLTKERLLDEYKPAVELAAYIERRIS